MGHRGSQIIHHQWKSFTFGLVISRLSLFFSDAKKKAASRSPAAYLLSRNRFLRTEAWNTKSLWFVQFRLSLRIWLLGTDSSQTLWWQLLMSIKPLRSVSLKNVDVIIWLSTTLILRSRKWISVLLASKGKNYASIILIKASNKVIQGVQIAMSTYI